MELNNLINREFVYWKKFYNNDLGLPDWEVRAKQRTDLIGNTPPISDYTLKKFEFEQCKILDAGCGTGGFLLSCLKNTRQNILCGLDINFEAVKLANDKINHFNTHHKFIITQSALENGPFKNYYFDFIYCSDVLEHVQNIEKSIATLWNLLKPGGSLFIHIPDYRWPQEPHYKIRVFPNKKWMVRKMLKFRDRPVDFLETLNFISPKYVKEIFIERYPEAKINTMHKKYSSFKGKLIGNIARVLNLKYDLLITKPE